MNDEQGRASKFEVKPEEVGSMEEVFGENDSMFNDAEKAALGVDRPVDGTVEVPGNAPVEGENTVTENMKDIDPDEGTVEDVVNDNNLAPKEIKYLKNETTGHIFEANPIIMGQRHLVPCTKEGKLVKDTRIEFNGMR